MESKTKKLVLGAGSSCGLFSEEREIEKIAAAGWDGVFTQWHEGKALPFKSVADAGLIYQSVHADFYHIDRLWEAGKGGDEEELLQIRCLRDCAAAGVDLVVMHTIIGMDRNSPSQIGVDRFGRIFDRAKEYGVRVALENTEGLVYLETLLSVFRNEKHVGFCVDTGHEQCYNGAADLITLYGDRLFCTHLNDNMGQTGAKITCLDDAHMLPFDGIIDWEQTAMRLNNVGYNGDLTFEIMKENRHERTTNSIYSALDFDAYLALALERAKKFAALVEGQKRR